MNITNPYGANTTVLLAGSCNASCDFCFWNKENAKIKAGRGYLDSVFSHLEKLPDSFKVLSVSGGEPTLSPMFGKFLARLGVHRRSHDLDRVVLTTHGGNLKPFITAIGCVIDHVNISRHGIGTADNVSIFGTDKIPTDDELRDLILRIHSETAMDVTLNCVVKPDVSVEFCNDFIEYAKDLGADAVSFRKVASDVSPTNAESAFVSKHGIASKADCPVCRGLVQDVDGFEVRWKGSVDEPSLMTNGIYELVIHPDGKLYRDWGMTSEVSIQKPVAPKVPVPSRASMSRYNGGCGGGGLGTGGC